MDLGLVQNPFLTWFQEWGQIVVVAGQLIFWLTLAYAAIYAAMQLKRLVDFKLGVVKAEKPAAAVDAVTSAPLVDQFVE
jgi:hypothetical protein